MAKVKKQNVLGNIQAAFAELYHRKKEIFSFSWVTVLLIMIYRYAVGRLSKSSYFQPFLNLKNYETYDYSHLHIPFEYVRYILASGEIFLESIIAVALFRLLLLSNTPKVRQTYFRKGGVYEDKVLFSIPIYFRFGKREFLYAATGCVLSTLFMFLWHLMFYLIMYHRYQLAQPMLPSYSSFYRNLFTFLDTWGREIVAPIYDAPFILIWPYLAIAEKARSSAFPALISSLKGNLARIIFITFCIFLPYHALGTLQRFFNSSFAAAGILDAEFFAYVNFHVICFYVCQLASLIFSANVYKSLISASSNDGGNAVSSLH